MSAQSSTPLLLWSTAQVDGSGVFLSQIVAKDRSTAFPQIRICDAPALGLSLILSRAEIAKLLEKAAPQTAFTNWTGAERIRITRPARELDEKELKAELTAVLQRDFVKERGELEIQFTRPWKNVLIPDEPFSLKILELPTAGVSASFIVRIQLHTAHDQMLGPWQISLTAKVWREIWVARSALKQHQSFSEADVDKERRDVLTLRDAPLLAQPDAAIELAENISAGAPIYERSVRARPVVHRGQVVDAQFQDGAIVISLKVEVLEAGAIGQLVRVRNPQSHREFRGKVQDEQTVLVSL